MPPRSASSRRGSRRGAGPRGGAGRVPFNSPDVPPVAAASPPARRRRGSVRASGEASSSASSGLPRQRRPRGSRLLLDEFPADSQSVYPTVEASALSDLTPVSHSSVPHRRHGLRDMSVPDPMEADPPVFTAPMLSPATTLPSDSAMADAARRREIRRGKRPMHADDDDPGGSTFLTTDPANQGSVGPAMLDFFSMGPSMHYVDSSDDDSGFVPPVGAGGSSSTADPDAAFNSARPATGFMSGRPGFTPWVPLPPESSSALGSAFRLRGVHATDAGPSRVHHESNSSSDGDGDGDLSDAEAHMPVPLFPLGSPFDYLSRVPATPYTPAFKARANRRMRMAIRRHRRFRRAKYRVSNLQLPLKADFVAMLKCNAASS